MDHQAFRQTADSEAPGADTYSFGCSDCALSNSEHCADCVVSYLCDERGHDPVVVSLEEVRVLRRLQSGGLIPPLRHSAAGGGMSQP